MIEAENFLAKLWCRLEEHGIPAPDIRLKTDYTGTVSMLLSFESAAEAELVLEQEEL
jgi:hypothetical protein